jgi:SAM-dependent methyltransferase
MMVENSTAILLFLLGLLWVVTYMARLDKEMFEDGTGSETVTYEDSAEIYDTFYAKVYDTLFSTPERLSFEKASMHELAFNEFSKPETKILDAACGTAPHAKWLVEEGYDVVGADTSEAMLKKARESCPGGRFYRMDITNASGFPPKSFSHALLMYFSFYQFRNPKIVIDTLYQWLKPGGFLIVHLVDPEKFDPILAAASPFPAFSLQKYSKQRVTESDVFFNEFKYHAKFIKDTGDETSTFEEVFTFPDNTYREHKHRLFMPSLSHCIDLIRSSGFTLKEQVDMTSVGYEYQYLLYFRK